MRRIIGFKFAFLIKKHFYPIVGVRIVIVSIWLVTLEKKIVTLKSESNRLNQSLACIKPILPCTYTAVVFSRNKRNSVVFIYLAARKGCWLFPRFGGGGYLYSIAFFSHNLKTIKIIRSRSRSYHAQNFSDKI